MKMFERADAEAFVLCSINLRSLMSINPTLTWNEWRRGSRGREFPGHFGVGFPHFIVDWRRHDMMRPLHRSRSGQKAKARQKQGKGKEKDGHFHPDLTEKKGLVQLIIISEGLIWINSLGCGFIMSV